MPLEWMDSQTTLTEICNAFRTDDLQQSGAGVCGEITEGRGRQLHTGAPLPSARAVATGTRAAGHNGGDQRRLGRTRWHELDRVTANKRTGWL